jgi:phosphatidylserine/phosphatidylglycerophosphate/cardiolipin synthase-like enzyme
VLLRDWLLTKSERGNDHTRLDDLRPGEAAWSVGNLAEPRIHGATYFTELLKEIAALRAGDILMFTDWRGDPDERLDGPGTEVSTVFAAAASRGVIVKGLVWRSHLDRFRFSAAENRHLGQEIEAAGGECLLDMRVRPLGSHHQKMVVIRHPDRPELDVAFVGGIDLCHSRRDTEEHQGDPEPQPMAAVYSPQPPWHDIQVALRGPAVADVETVFRERWEDPQPLSRNPVHRLTDRIRGADTQPGELPPATPEPPAEGTCAVQLLRTYPRRRHGYAFAPEGERSVARAYTKALQRARSLIYLEDQYLWSRAVASTFADALRSHPELRLIAVVPHHPDQDGAAAVYPQHVGRQAALELLVDAGGDRVAVYGIENDEATPIYVHAKTCVIDDVWAAVGSDNFNRRSWTWDSELGVAVVDETLDERAPSDPAGLGDGARRFARQLRLALACEHLGRGADDVEDLLDPARVFAAFASAAAALQSWHDGERRGPRPPGRITPAWPAEVSRAARWWASTLYRFVYDPDGRSIAERRRGAF